MKFGGLAQLARAPALHAGGQRFESVILHQTLLKRSEGNEIKTNIKHAVKAGGAPKRIEYLVNSIVYASIVLQRVSTNE